VQSQIIRLQTGNRETVTDITPQCRDFAAAASAGGAAARGEAARGEAARGEGGGPGGSDGLLNVFVPHATAGLAVIELGSGSDRDLLDTLRRLLPVDDRYQHAHGSAGHGRTHVMPAVLAPSLTVPVLAGRMALGTWQSIALVDLNVDNADREVRLSFLG
jgi:secondary thiamine-phosphate synthase enzyme